MTAAEAAVDAMAAHGIGNSPAGPRTSISVI